MTPTLLLLACLRFQATGRVIASPPSGKSKGNNSVKLAWAAGAFCTGVLMVAAGNHLLGPARGAAAWERYLAVSLATKQFRADAKAHGSTAKLGQLDPESTEVIERMARHLEDSLRYDPHNPRTNARLAAVRLRQFGLAQQSSENPMSLAMIRDAALASRVGSRREQAAWLRAALDENYQLLTDALRAANRAVHGSPLQGAVYTSLAELSFLRSPQPEHPAALISQALLVRPHSGNVLLAAGRESAIAGDQDRALHLLHEAFHSQREIQKLVIEILAPQTATAEFVAAFEPDLEELRLLREHYVGAQRQQAVAEVTQLLAEAAAREATATRGLAAARLWQESSRMQRDLGQISAALEAARMAGRSAPLDYDVREHLAHSLVAAGHYEEATKQWQWCLTRKPGNDHIRQRIRSAKQLALTRNVESLEQASRAASRR
jgi:cytochrome c-type biogenesis protein CcmH/NrfG